MAGYRKKSRIKTLARSQREYSRVLWLAAYVFFALFMLALFTQTQAESLNGKRAILVGNPFVQIPQSSVIIKAILRYEPYKNEAQMMMVNYTPDSMGPHDPLHVMEGVNQAINSVAYRSESAGQDQWLSPEAFLKLGGDCEDYAIAKYVALRQLGFDKDALKIVLLKDREQGEGHAVVSITIKGQQYFLDNRTNRILNASHLSRYMPVAALSEDRLWVYIS